MSETGVENDKEESQSLSSCKGSTYNLEGCLDLPNMNLEEYHHALPIYLDRVLNNEY